MPARERGKTPTGFRRQLLARLRNDADALNVTSARLQQRVAFERFLARLIPFADWVVKGGFALELRYGWQCRPTRDVDVRVVTHVGGGPFADFHIDVSSGDALILAPDVVRGSELLHFAGIEPVIVPVYPVVQHLAEKMHAYAVPRLEANTRVKDLVDLALLARLAAVDGEALLMSTRATFAARGTSPLPTSLPEPPAAWRLPFDKLSAGITSGPPLDLDRAYVPVSRFWGPVLIAEVKGQTWNPAPGIWEFGDRTVCPRPQ